jgi:hypothetical protein
VSLDVGGSGKLVAQGLGQIGHLAKVSGALLVNPAKKLGGAEAFFSEPLAKARQPFQIVIKQVGGHVRGFGAQRE